MSYTQSDPCLVARLKTMSQFMGVGVVIIGLLVMAGWLLKIYTLQNLLPGLATMKFNTSVSFALSGLSLLVASRLPRLAQVAAGVVLLVGLLTISQYGFGWHLGIDELLVRDTSATAATLYPGRMAPVTAINFTLIGSALLFLHRRRYLMAHFLTAIEIFFSLVAGVGYIYSVESLYRAGSFSSISLHATVAFILIGFSVLFANPERGFAALVSNGGVAGYIVRRLLPATVLIPIIAGWISWQGETRGLYDSQFVLALFATSNVAISAALVTWIARTLRTTDEERLKALDALRVANDELEVRVQERTADLERVNQALAQEVKEHISTEKLLEEGHSALRILQIALDSVSEGAQIIGFDWRYLYLNDAAAVQGRRGKHELLGFTMQEAYPGVEQTPLYSMIQRCKDAQIPASLENHFTFPDGSSGWFDLTIQPTSEGVFILSSDISERKKAEAALRESERRLRLLAQNSPDIIYIFDLKSQRATYLNRPEILGYLPSELDTTLLIRDAIHPDDLDRVTTRWHELVASNDSAGMTMMEFRIQDKAGEWQWVQSRETVFASDAEGKATEVLVTLTIITEHKQIEQQSRDLEKERSRVAMLGDFARDTSHDFRTPLTIITTSLYLLSRLNDPEKQKAQVAKADHQVKRLIALLDRMQMIVRLDSIPNFTFQSLDLNALVRDFGVRVNFEAQDQDKHISVVYDLTDGKLMVDANSTELYAALNELGRNAVRCTPIYGTITLCTKREGDQAVVQVRDTGIGIPHNDLPHIFERLYRVDKARSLETGGAGLGLSIAKRIIDLHHGDIVAESIVGEGSLFQVFLPLSQ